MASRVEYDSNNVRCCLIFSVPRRMQKLCTRIEQVFAILGAILGKLFVWNQYNIRRRLIPDISVFTARDISLEQPYKNWSTD